MGKKYSQAQGIVKRVSEKQKNDLCVNPVKNSGPGSEVCGIPTRKAGTRSRTFPFSIGRHQVMSTVA